MSPSVGVAGRCRALALPGAAARGAGNASPRCADGRSTVPLPQLDVMVRRAGAGYREIPAASRTDGGPSGDYLSMVEGYKRWATNSR